MDVGIYDAKRPLPGLGPGIRAFLPDRALGEDVGAHGSSPWAEGPRIEAGHGALLAGLARNSTSGRDFAADELHMKPRSHCPCNL